MSYFSRHLKGLAAGGALAALATILFVVLQTTGMPGAVVAQQQAKEEPNAPVLAAGFVTAEGKLTRSGGAKLSVKRVVLPDSNPREVEYDVVFAQELSAAPVVVATTGNGRYQVRVDATKKGFTVSFEDPKDALNPSKASNFNFIVVKVSERTP